MFESRIQEKELLDRWEERNLEERQSVRGRHARREDDFKEIRYSVYGFEVQDILFTNLLDLPDTQEFLVSRDCHEYEIHIYAKRDPRVCL